MPESLFQEFNDYYNKHHFSVTIANKPDQNRLNGKLRIEKQQ